METQTKPQTLEALLRRWAELEPEWAKMAQDTIPPDEAYHIGAWAHAGYYVQIVAQQAIERRGWSWSIVHIGTDEAMVFIPGASLRDRLESLGKCNDADTPAAALLSAYVQALEAQA